MPTYDYKCENCGHFEKVQKISAPPLTECPACGGKVERLISKNVSIVFKGPGFYSTDHNQKVKDRVRSINKERQVDNQAILDGDVKSFVNQSEETTKKIQEA
ncbi:MAG: zinc ribbon domain-containing protein [Syntrophomonas sp.]